MLRLLFLAFGLYLLLLVLRQTVSMLLLAYVAIILALFFDYFIGLVSRELRLGRRSAALIVFSLFFAAIGVAMIAVAPTLEEQARDAAKELPELYEEIKSKLSYIGRNYPRLARIGRAVEEREFGLGSLVQSIAEYLRLTLSTLVMLFVLLIAVIFLSLNPALYSEGVLRLLPENSRGRARSVAERMAETLRYWMVGRALLMVLVAAITVPGLLLIGIKYALLLGVIAGLTDIIPYFGPILGLIPALLVAATISWSKFLWVLVLYAVVQSVESYIAEPLIMRRQVRVPPALSIFGIVLFGKLMGVLGAVLAVPTLAIIIVLIEELYLKPQR